MARKKGDARLPDAAASDGGTVDPAASAPATKKKGRGKDAKPRKKAQSVKQAQAEIKRREQMAEALDYRRQGYTYAEIAEVMNISTTTAHTYVTTAIREIPEEVAADVRAMMVQRLDKMMVAAYEAFSEEPGNMSLVDVVLRLDDRKARLLGIYKDFDSDASPIGQLANTLAAAMAADRPVLRPDGPVPKNPVL